MNIKSNPDWDEKSPQDKRLSLIGIVLAVIILVLAALQMTGVAETTVIFVPLMAMLMLIQAMQMWSSRRVVAIMCIAVAIFLFMCAVLFAIAL